ncbi:MAG: hypothetical protein V3U78_05480 [Thiotrichaceae bacterium]
MSEIEIDLASEELQRLYLNDAFFHYCVKGGLNGEDIILGMAKRNKELSDQNIALQINCTCQIKPIFNEDNQQPQREG